MAVAIEFWGGPGAEPWVVVNREDPEQALDWNMVKTFETKALARGYIDALPAPNARRRSIPFARG